MGSSSGAPSSSGAVADGSVVPTGGFCERNRVDATVYCADFDSGEVDVGAFGTVIVAGEGSSVTSTDFSTEHGRSLDVLVGTDSNQSVAQLSLPLSRAPAAARIEFDMFIQTVGEATGRIGNDGFLPLFAGPAAVFTIGVRDPGSDGNNQPPRRQINPYIDFVQGDIANMGSGAWVHVVADLKQGDRSLQVSQPGDVIRYATGSPIPPVALTLGILRGGPGGDAGTGVAWRVLYDNIIVTAL